MKIGKRGSHVSLVLSFSMFVIFLIFVYVIVSASFVQEDTKKYSLNQMSDKVLKEIKEDVWILRIYNSTTNCVNVSLPEPIPSGSALVFDSSGNLVNSALDGSTLSFNGTGGFAKAYYSESLIDESPFVYSRCDDIIKPVNALKEKRISNSKIEAIINNLSINYDSVRSSFGIQNNYEIDISFEYSNGTVIGGKKREPKVEIYAEEIVIFYFSPDGQNEKGVLITKLW